MIASTSSALAGVAGIAGLLAILYTYKQARRAREMIKSAEQEIKRILESDEHKVRGRFE